MMKRTTSGLLVAATIAAAAGLPVSALAQETPPQPAR
jgi:hypothetical protein